MPSDTEQKPEDLAQLKKSRKASRAWITRTAIKLEALLVEDPQGINMIDIDTMLEDFNLKIRRLDSLQEQIESCLPDDDSLYLDIEEAGNFRDKNVAIRLKVIKLKSMLTNQNNEKEDSVSISNTSSSSSNVKLPKIKLQEYNGDPLQWQPFWEQFEAAVDSSDIPDVSKFNYLRNLLTGDAKICVSGLALTADNYKVALELLKRRFGRKEKIIFGHIQALLSITTDNVDNKGRSSCNVSNLRKFQDSVLTHIRALDVLGVTGENYGVIMTPLILAKIPTDIRLEWAKEATDEEGLESDLKGLLNFLDKEISRRERSLACISTRATSDSKPNDFSRRHERISTAAALPVTRSPLCVFCAGNNHPPWKCAKLNSVNMQERKRLVKDAGLCFCCFSKDHRAKDCNKMCRNCQGKHNSFLCSNKHNNYVANSNVNINAIDSNASNNHVSPVNQNVTNVSTSMSHVMKNTVLQTAKVIVKGTKGKTTANVLFDSGSDMSYITGSLVSKIVPRYINSENISYTAFGQRSCKSTMNNVYKFDIACISGGVDQMLTAVEVPHISAPMVRKAVPAEMVRDLRNIVLADDFTVDRLFEVDILIGQDHYWSFFRNGLLHLDVGLVAQETTVGWVLSGSWSDPTESRPNMVRVSQLLCLNDISEGALQNFWNLESIGISDDLRVVDPVLEEFNKSLKFVDKRYEVSLPWKKHFGSVNLVSNEVIAKKRLVSLGKRLKRNPELESLYNMALLEMESNDIIQEVPASELLVPNPVFYLPHHPVVKESSLTTKIRPVFDASATGPNGVSLNDCLENGPNLIPSLPEILLRFRRWPIALTADIEKAFLQLKVRREDQDVHRFLWCLDGNTRVMKFLRLPFGNKSSPFLLIATIKFHLENYAYFRQDDILICERALDELKSNMYVDDWLSGADTEEEACELFAQAYSIMADANLPLTKLGSNNMGVAQMMYNEYDSKFSEVECHKVLGLKWVASSDVFTYEGLTCPPNILITKRVVLSFIARFYDPLGFLAPVLVTAKLIFQEIWKLSLDWDEEVPSEISKSFKCWVEDLSTLRALRIPRCYSQSCWGELTGVELHAFGDASEKCYGTAIYLKCYRSDGSESVSLVMAKAKIAPLKVITLPRLELLAALLAARLLCFVIEALKLSNDVKYFCWTDSMITLSWIKGSPSRWRQFVGNRVAEIQKLTSKDSWYHLPGKQNPADLITRGMSAKDLSSSDKWLNGPDWLLGPNYPITEKVEMVDLNSLPEAKMIVLSAPSDQADHNTDVIPFERWGSFLKTVRVFSWLLRFLNNTRSGNPKLKGELSYEEMSEAKKRMLIYIQSRHYHKEILSLKSIGKVPKGSSISRLTPFVDSEGLLRVKGRLALSGLSFSERHPIILPKCYISRLIVAFQHNLLKHAGVQTMLNSLRNEFWIVSCRRLAKDIVRKCVSCRRFDSRACNAPTAPLPAFRATEAPPFSVTGVDHAGPLYCVDVPDKKLYICLFTCAVVRAVHLELADSLSTSDFVLCFKRFVSRRGVPSVMYSDNAKTFHSAKKELQKYYGPDTLKWNFIVPLSPWWGGWWERLIRSVKSSLKKSVGRSCLSYRELETTLFEIEAVINSRPITFNGDEVDNSSPLTPNHFLLGKSALVGPMVLEDPGTKIAESLCEREQLRDAALERFWHTWRSEYLKGLPLDVCKFSERGSLNIGSLVLIGDDNSPRLQWPIGVVEKLHMGKDGLVRSVDIRTSQGRKTRAIQRVYPLEISSSENVQNFAPDTTNQPSVSAGHTENSTRPVRNTKKPQYLTDYVE